MKSANDNVRTLQVFSNAVSSKLLSRNSGELIGQIKYYLI